ncbi:hypothetical protein N7490_010987 [Penicillium lividum]|nr:hypothetical protein N7490_010987 [Penicillium lividum]
MPKTKLNKSSGNASNGNGKSSRIANGDGFSIDEDFFTPNGDYADLLATLTELQRLDSKHEFDLPQLVVCGEQSAGKSSVLEAITSIPFPRGDGTCTRFVTQINLRRPKSDDWPERIEIELRSSDQPNPMFQKKIEVSQLTDRAVIEDIITEAGKHMDINKESNKKFSKDILTINVEKHGYPMLSLVDTPGIIHSEGVGSTGNKGLADEIVHDWIKQDNTIIIAVIDATRDLASHGILDEALKVDPRRERTIGIITKIDMYKNGDPSTQKWVDTALNEDEKFNFPRGWHVLRNRNGTELQNRTTTSERDETERQYFEDENNGWQAVVEKSQKSPESCGYGVKTLKRRLQDLQKLQVKKSSLRIRDQVDEKLRDLENQMNQVSISGMPITEAKREFRKICIKLGDDIVAGIDGHYETRGSLYALGDLGDSKEKPPRYLRNNIRDCDAKFALAIRNGHRDYYAPDHQGSRKGGKSEGAMPDKWVARVLNVIGSTKGTEIPTEPDPSKISLLFQDYSKGWKDIAHSHIQAVEQTCREYFEWLSSAGLKDSGFTVLETSLTSLFYQELDRRKALARIELDKLERDRNRPARTLHVKYEKKLLRVRHEEAMRTMAKVNHATRERNGQNALTPLELSELASLTSRANHEEQIAQRFMDQMLVYYRIASERFIDEVVIHVNERHVLDALPEVVRELAINDSALDKFWDNGTVKGKQTEYDRLKKDADQYAQIKRKL